MLLTLAACASAGSTGKTSGAKVNQDLITSSEITVASFRSAYDVVQQLRPNWFSKTSKAATQTMGMEVSRSAAGGLAAVQTTAGAGLLVYLDNARLGGIEQLRELTVGGIESIEFMDAAKAAAYLPGLGSSVIVGAVVVHSIGGH